MLTKKSREKIDREIAKYPPEHQQSAVMAALHIAQDEHGWLSVSVMDHIAELLGMRPIQVYEVASFYSMYDLEPVGRHKVSVCTNISCLLRGSDDIVAHLKKRLGIGFNETTPDGRFTLKEVECLAACGGAPMFQIGKTYYENLTPDRIDEILAGLE